MPGALTKVQIRWKCGGAQRGAGRSAVYQAAGFLSARNMVLLGRLKFWGRLIFYKTFFSKQKHWNLQTLSHNLIRNFLREILPVGDGKTNKCHSASVSNILSAHRSTLDHEVSQRYWATSQAGNKPRGGTPWLTAKESCVVTSTFITTSTSHSVIKTRAKWIHELFSAGFQHLSINMGIVFCHCCCPTWFAEYVLRGRNGCKSSCTSTPGHIGKSHISTLLVL